MTIKNIVKLITIVPLIGFSYSLFADKNAELVKAVNTNNPNIAEITRLLDAGADVNTRNPANQDPVFLIAVYYGNTDVIKLLAKYKADIRAKDRYGRGAIRWAHEHLHRGVNRQQVLETLKSLGLTPEAATPAATPAVPAKRA